MAPGSREVSHENTSQPRFTPGRYGGSQISFFQRVSALTRTSVPTAQFSINALPICSTSHKTGRNANEQ